MKTCGYCGLALENRYCSFCEMELKDAQMTENAERMDIRVRKFVLNVATDKTTQELLTFSTYELLGLLKMVRASRHQSYGEMRAMRETIKHVAATSEGQTLEQTQQLERVFRETGNMYEHITRKMFVLENILRERLGYIPRRVTDKMLEEFLMKIECDKTTNMNIQVNEIVM